MSKGGEEEKENRCAHFAKVKSDFCRMWETKEWWQMVDGEERQRAQRYLAVSVTV